ANNRKTDRIYLNQKCLEIIHQASTLFLATLYTSNISDNASDLRLNHRGGLPRFVRIYEENGHTYIIIRDYPGNRFYQSLGNSETDPVVDLVFTCFTTGDMLHVTDIAENICDNEAEQALNLKLFGSKQYSPYNPPVRYLVIELEKMGIPSRIPTSHATLVEIKKLTKHISRFTF
ncbi:unnamed protein product, partial [Rotaria sp. Silwood1]